MKTLIVISLIILVSGCTTSARHTLPVVSDNTRYDSYSCDSLYMEASHLAVFGTELSRTVDRKRTSDMVLIGSFGVLSVPMVNPDQTTSENELLSRVKGDMQLIRIVSQKNNCPIGFKSNESAPYIVDNSTNPVLDLKPVDRSVIYKAVKLY